MASFEQMPKRDTVSREWHPAVEIERTIAGHAEQESTRNELFEKYMEQHIVEQFFETARDVGFSSEQIVDMQNTLSQFSDKEILGALSLPNELCEPWMERVLTDIDEKRTTPRGAILSLIGLGKKYGFGVGFHTSPYDIRPDEKGKWVIKGSEKDHRDDDLMMAYYSSQYRHLFKSKHPQFIYVVRTTTEDRTDGNWYRAPSLSVVMRLPFAQVHQYVEQAARRIESEEQQNAQKKAA